MEDLSTGNLQQLRDLLLQSQSELEQQLNISRMAAGVVKLDQTTVGRVSRVDAMQQQSMAVSTREMALKRLKKVKLALKNLEEECYGYCERCDEDIPVKRLLAQPEANLCLICQDKQDRQQ